MFFDLDLKPLFRHVAEAGPDRITALAFVHPVFRQALAEYAGKNVELDGQMERIATLSPLPDAEPEERVPHARADGPCGDPDSIPVLA